MLKWKLSRQIESEILPKRRHSLISRMPSRQSPFGTRNEKLPKRKSLGEKRLFLQENKENLNMSSSRSPFGMCSSAALQDLSNGQSPNRSLQNRRGLLEIETTTRRRNNQPQTYACTLPTFDIEYSPCDMDRNIIPKLQNNRHSFDGLLINDRRNFHRNKSERNTEECYEEPLSSSKMGDTTLDKMIDAIIESAKKEEDFTTTLRKRVKLTTDLEYSFLRSEKNSMTDIHEMEVKTPEPCHLKRQKAVRRKTKTEPCKNNFINNKLIGLTLPNGIPSPETPEMNININTEDLANMDTPQDIAFVVDSFPGLYTKDHRDCSTPTTAHRTNSIKRCLHFSPDSEEDSLEEKRKSVASSTSTSSNNSSRYGPVKGSVDIAIFVENDKLNVHVIRCRDLQRANGNSSINAYVKVALLPSEDGSENGFQRTAVHRHSSRPYFDHRFKFDLKDGTSIGKRIQLAVWHRDRELKRSEFLGCMSFPVKNVIKSAINGSFKLQPQTCLTIPPISASATTTVINNSTQLISTNNGINNNNSSSSSGGNPNCISSLVAPAMAAAAAASTSAADRRRSSVEEDVISIDSASAAAANLIEANTGQPIAFSKKAIHQRDADENLFLRFLELDPPPDTNPPAVPATTSTSATLPGGSSSGGTPQTRRSSTFKQIGRTPFTISKKLTRTADKGFGFSIVWTHPPRIEKVEPGMSADRNGIVPGDYVIFVDKHNVVTMPEADVLNLIRSQGNTLNLEIFRRSASSVAVPTMQITNTTVRVPATAQIAASAAIIANVNGITKPPRVASAASNYTEEMSPALKQSIALGPRSSTACSNASIETTKRRLHLPQVTFSKESIAPCQGIDDQRRRILLQVVSREQNFINALQFGMQRFVTPLAERRDLISPNDHKTLFQNVDELIRISEDIVEQLVQDDHEPQINFASRVYLSKTTAICAAYKKYCNGIKRADCVLVNKSRQPGSEFVTFITEPQVPRKRPDLTQFIHRPLQHFREILKLMQLLASHCRVDSEEHKNFTTVINELQSAYREITVGSGLMEPLGEGRPLLTLQDLESRMVFTRCKPFTLAVQGRQWIFGGDLSRVEGRSVKPYWTLLFSDILLFAKVSRDRVLFITEEPLPISNIVDSCFTMRKKSAEFRITVDPNGRIAESPTAYCAPDISRTPKKSARRKSLLLRAPSPELKAVWQNLLQRQIFLVNAALGSTPLSSPLDSPDILNTLVPLSDLGATTTSMASIKLSSLDSINMKNQQNRSINASQQIEQLIDEKCRILNKTGTPKGSAIHLANWMKGQLDKQQEQARLAAESQHDTEDENETIIEPHEEEERITYWTREQLEKRTKELNLAKENGQTKQPIHNQSFVGGKRLSGVEEVAISDNEEEIKSPSRSTTSDSQITVRSSPIANVVDKLSVCRHCHKNCKQKLSPSPPLLSNSLKVQHSQASPNRCCQLNPLANPSIINGIASATTASSTTSSTVTSDRSQRQNSNVSLSSKRNSMDLVHSTSSPTARLLLNGHCSGSESDRETVSTTHTTSTSTRTRTTAKSSIATALTTVTTCSSHKSPGSSTSLKHQQQQQHNSTQQKPHQKSPSTPSTPAYRQKFMQCNCKCTPEDFTRTQISPDEIKQETCKLIEDVSKLPNPPRYDNDLHKNCKCICKDKTNIATFTTGTAAASSFNSKFDRTNPKNEDDWSLVLIGLAQFNPAAKLVNSEAFVPSISVVPPTPDNVLSKTSTNIWDNTSTTTTNIIIKNNSVPRQAIIENIPEDSPDESPQDEEPPYLALSTGLRRYGTLSSLEKVPSDEMNENASSDDAAEIVDELEDDDDIEVITREVFPNDQNPASLRNWTARAGSFVAEKMSFFEESRAFIDKYLGRWNNEQDMDRCEEEQVDECTSGATSGEEVWGTPTSGGDNEDLQMLNSDHTQSSPTKSSSSLTGDDDTELMMDELLMAPPMTASTIRGLLPRRRLEPLFEEETESDEEKTQPDIDIIKKGETSANGNDLKDSIGNLSDEETTTTTSSSPPPPPRTGAQLITRSSAAAMAGAAAGINSSIKYMPQATGTMSSSIIQTTPMSIITTTTYTITAAAAATTAMVMTTSSATLMTTATSTTTTNIVRRAKFSPPPPPPRRLLLTQSELKTSTIPPQQPGAAGPALNMRIHQGNVATQLGTVAKSGTTADICSLVGAQRMNKLVSVSTNTTNIPINKNRINTANQKTAGNIQDSVKNIVHAEEKRQRQSAQIMKSLTTQEALIMPTSTTLSTVALTTILPTTTITTTTTAPTATSTTTTPPSQSPSQMAAAPGSGLSPRLEMRLALNHDIMGDEDLICYDPGPDLTTILGHDLSTFHRLTGRDLLNRSANRIQPKEAVISYSQQRNSKMDTPTLNRKRQQNLNTWNNSVYVDRIVGSATSVASCRNSNNSSEESKLSDLELLAKREKMFSTSQLKNGSPVKTTMTTNNISLMGAGTGSEMAIRARKLSRDESNILLGKGDSRTNRFLNFLSRRNSENQLTQTVSRDSLDDTNSSSTPDRRLFSPRKDNDKPPLNRRFWKQLTKRRRASSVSEFIES